jgi:hypothetical protein
MRDHQLKSDPTGFWRSMPEAYRFSEHEAEEFRLLLTRTFHTAYERELIKAKKIYGPGGVAKLRYTPNWKEGRGVTPTMLKSRIVRAGFGGLLPYPSSLLRMVRGERAWPFTLLYVALQQVGTSPQVFLGLGQPRPAGVDDLIAAAEALAYISLLDPMNAQHLNPQIQGLTQATAVLLNRIRRDLETQGREEASRTITRAHRAVIDVLNPPKSTTPQLR